MPKACYASFVEGAPARQHAGIKIKYGGMIPSLLA